MNAELAASYRRCREVVRRSGSNFAYAFCLLPREKRLAMDALYAFAWHTDEIGDGLAPDHEKQQTLLCWRGKLEEALAGSTGDPYLPAIAATVHRFEIPPRLLFELIEGVGSDLSQRRFATRAELATYCYHVAGTVGLACLHIWGFHGSGAEELAQDCGEAFQLTNILRDLREDAARGRVYLPLEDFDRCQYSPEEFLQSVTDERFDKLLDLQLTCAERLYERAGGLANHLSAEGRLVFRLMFARYQAIFAEIRRQPRAVLQGRVSLLWPKKIAIATRELACHWLPAGQRKW